MAPANEEKPQRLQSRNLILEELRDELMIYDKEKNKAFCLNQTAAFVWKHSDGKTTAAEMAEILGLQLGMPVKEQVIWFALDALSKDGLLAPSTVLPPAAGGMTRRGLLQRMGMGAMAVPLVTVLFVSPLRAHASSIPPVPPPGGPIKSSGAASSRSRGGGFWQWVENLF